MRLYHGTNADFSIIDISKSQKHKDFGQGFYLTDIYSQAEELAKKRARLFGGEPIVQIYEFDETLLKSDSLNVLVFDSPNAEWANFIFKNRDKRNDSFKHCYDIVVGPIADDGAKHICLADTPKGLLQ